MSGTMEPKVKSRRLAVRLGLVVVYAALIAGVFSFGKGHTIIIDNKDSEDGSIKAIESLSVSVDGQEPIDLSAGDRDMAKVRGQGHRVEVTVKDGQKVEKRISVPLTEDVLLLSLPKLLAGQAAVIKFVPLEAVAPADEGNNNAFTSPTDPTAPAVPGAPAMPGAPAVPGAPAKPGAPPAP